ncbi:hypothetical protein [Arthrospira platensis]|jgi:hypothetical protein|uniref:DUF2281 domain-containing protein n=1 Tax=Limnospira platensis NIES-46 TaxID=1236695 RepID=A0A5M3T6M4_LIMPL|nr:hypothetical protein [Arthrospira platensis]AMW26896.1 hypothetical protein AP285_01675 [Arthrospira platensis YZ]MBD2670236.1 hypothetical protein [Arthrospira platensis FACHB-439]MBD2710849.1 hypothetical protein [Arthrospira platensis FACHB-835]MDF2211715.1 hypothetical protein [Arthrospira platensis NCB002]MDT9183460.1 hypothetical protein [Limnospira sp. PMC 289.06]MDT9294482.1 hypothetical protein [Arthrospira platensis PCC 7345]QQW29645.1 hypothetical protein AP9108_01740 [Arthrosp
MTLKEQIIKELDSLPESTLEVILENIRPIKSQEKVEEDPFFQAYLDTLPQWEEVYRRLADA